MGVAMANRKGRSPLKRSRTFTCATCESGEGQLVCMPSSDWFHSNSWLYSASSWAVRRRRCCPQIASTDQPVHIAISEPRFVEPPTSCYCSHSVSMCSRLSRYCPLNGSSLAVVLRLLMCSLHMCLVAGGVPSCLHIAYHFLLYLAAYISNTVSVSCWSVFSVVWRRSFSFESFASS